MGFSLKQISFIIAIMVLILALSGCGKDPVQDDLINYINNGILPLADLEKEATDKYSSVTGDNYKDDLELYNTLQESVVPKYRELVDKLEAIKPQTDEVRKLHEMYIEAANTQFNAFNQILSAIESQDRDKITEANDNLAKARKLIRDYQFQLEELAKKHNVTFNEK